MSHAGRKTFIKSILASIPTYFMSLGLLPASLCYDLERLMKGFWWAFPDLVRHPYLCAWDKVKKPKALAGGCSQADGKDPFEVLVD